jgi:hypothetical protein
VSDAGGLSAVSSATVNVTNVAPTVSASFASGAVSCGANNGTLNVSFTDPGPDAFTASVDWGEGATPESLGAVSSPFSATHTYAAAGSYPATVTDDDGGAGSATASVRVNYEVTLLRPLGDPAKDVFKVDEHHPGEDQRRRLRRLAAVGSRDPDPGGQDLGRAAAA